VSPADAAEKVRKLRSQIAPNEEGITWFEPAPQAHLRIALSHLDQAASFLDLCDLAQHEDDPPDSQ
jgi:hypothetical protein